MTRTQLAHLFLLPPNAQIVVGLLGLIFLALGWTLGWVCLVFAWFSLWFLSVPRIESFLIQLMPFTPFDPDGGAELIVVPGMRVGDPDPHFDDRGYPSRLLLERLHFAAYLSQRMRLPVAITGGPSTTLTEAKVMEEVFTQELRCPVHFVEAASQNTFENAQFMAQLLEAHAIKRIALVTQRVDSPRTCRSFERAGFEVIPAPVPRLRPPPGIAGWVPTACTLEENHRLVYELIGTLYYELLKR